MGGTFGTFVAASPLLFVHIVAWAFFFLHTQPRDTGHEARSPKKEVLLQKGLLQKGLLSLGVSSRPVQPLKKSARFQNTTTSKAQSCYRSISSHGPFVYSSGTDQQSFTKKGPDYRCRIMTGLGLAVESVVLFENTVHAFFSLEQVTAHYVAAHKNPREAEGISSLLIFTSRG